jgi:hypothetical protein
LHTISDADYEAMGIGQEITTPIEEDAMNQRGAGRSES